MVVNMPYIVKPNFPANLLHASRPMRAHAQSDQLDRAASEEEEVISSMTEGTSGELDLGLPLPEKRYQQVDTADDCLIDPS